MDPLNFIEMERNLIHSVNPFFFFFFYCGNYDLIFLSFWWFVWMSRKRCERNRDNAKANLVTLTVRLFRHRVPICPQFTVTSVGHERTGCHTAVTRCHRGSVCEGQEISEAKVIPSVHRLFACSHIVTTPVSFARIGGVATCIYPSSLRALWKTRRICLWSQPCCLVKLVSLSVCVDRLGSWQNGLYWGRWNPRIPRSLNL